MRIHWIDLPHDWNLLASQEGLSYLQLFWQYLECTNGGCRQHTAQQGPTLAVILTVLSAENGAEWTAAACLLGLRVRILPGYRRLSLTNIMCCLVEVCVTDRSLDQRNPTKCVCLCVCMVCGVCVCVCVVCVCVCVWVWCVCVCGVCGVCVCVVCVWCVCVCVVCVFVVCACVVYVWCVCVCFVCVCVVCVCVCHCVWSRAIITHYTCST